MRKQFLDFITLHHYPLKLQLGVLQNKHMVAASYATDVHRINPLNAFKNCSYIVLSKDKCLYDSYVFHCALCTHERAHQHAVNLYHYRIVKHLTQSFLDGRFGFARLGLPSGDDFAKSLPIETLFVVGTCVYVHVHVCL